MLVAIFKATKSGAVVRIEFVGLKKGNSYEAKKAIASTLGFSKTDCHMDFFASSTRGVDSTSVDDRIVMLGNIGEAEFPM